MSYNSGYPNLGIDLTFSSAYAATARNLPKVGTRIFTDDGKCFVFVEAGATVSAGDAVTIKIGDSSSNFSNVVERCDAATEQVIGIATVAATDGQFLWIQTKGDYATANVTTSLAAGKMLIGTSTAGRLNAVANDADEVVIPIAMSLVAEPGTGNSTSIRLCSPF